MRSRLVPTMLKCIVLLTFVPMSSPAGSPDGDYFLEVNRSIDVFGRVYKEVTANYVDEIQPQQFMEAGIEAMLNSLDPYTIFIDREDGDEVELLTSGKYGGIGVTIGYRDKRIQVITVMDGYSAQRQGIAPGDWILEVDSVSVEGVEPSEVKNLTRGAPGTEVSLLIEREGEDQPLTFVLIREEIRLKNVTYAEFVADGIGYIRLERFSRKAGEEVRQAIRELKKDNALKGIVLDVRGNPGGLLDAAVDVVSKFVPKGSLVVSTKGRQPEAVKAYHSDEEPMVPDLPLIVLTDRESASASEIVSGALQDLDRGLVVGDRTFGKGLVQTILPLNYGAQLKVTTARYYIPSGRSIQEIDYKNGNEGGLFEPDSEHVEPEYRTAGGRVVYEHGGITPDSIVSWEDAGPMVNELGRKSMFFRFVNHYAGSNGGGLPSAASSEMLEEFRKFLKERDFSYRVESETAIIEVREDAEALQFGDETIADLDRLLASFDREKEQSFDRFRPEISHFLEVELAARLNGEKGRIEMSLKNDVQLEVAIALLEDVEAYRQKIKG